MHLRVSFAFMAVAASLVSGSGDCNNPIFSGPLKVINNQRLQTLPQPQVVPDFLTCTLPNLSANNPICCNATTFNPAIESFSQLQAYIKEVTTAVDNYNMTEIMNECLERMHATSQQCTILSDAMQTIRNLYHPLLQCQNGIMGYTQGLLCSACDPTYHRFYDIASNTITLTQSTCDNTYSMCSPFLDSLQPSLLHILDDVRDFTQLVPDSDRDKQEVLKEIAFTRQVISSQNSICQLMNPAVTGCKDWLCNYLMKGLDLNLTLSHHNILWNHHPNIENGYDAMFRLWDSMHEMTGKMMTMTASASQQHSQLISSLHGVVKAMSVAARSSTRNGHADVKWSSDTSSSNSFDAYKVGCSAKGLYADACQSSPTPWDVPSNKGLSKAAIVGIVIGVVVIVAIVGVFIYMCYRKRARGLTLDDHQPFINDAQYIAH